ncbi:ribosome silencing factor [Blattabacterium cuenoti]|uniref:ribosome silencing factor n=1 Tax=Blattabacterium cuenoti TaxID=1653831 RepID=UPI00163C948C|nr:ribosome silencing factor [Blattabacterium cuenoti]
MLLDKIIEGIQVVKGEDISIINLEDNTNFICDYFVICNGESHNQVYAISQSIEKITIDKLKEKPWHIEGLKNKEWILVDYISIVVHIFKKQLRSYYNIENLWNKNSQKKIRQNL